MLNILITSKTRIKLLLKFFLDSESKGYLQGLAQEFGESSNAVRVELNRFEEAGLLESQLDGRKKIFRVNYNHPLVPDITNMVRKVTRLDALIDNVVDRLQGLDEVWISSKSIDDFKSGRIELIFIGEEFDIPYLKSLIKKAENHMNVLIGYKIAKEISDSDKPLFALIWVNK
ncbi:helix-turn-helix domain-containing protein [Phaeocystidibacter marisrubri]|uniref:ArsR family transcriptional regulator n=1 Tax=Phaeocystidibacter marisrubri TaxID=1577780 RepID=A0A6L3ZI90_9FLAO|nr:ArsR family transcriptional regulator [Phaeocystidibacter marisrubri]KAB2817594.1 ArsR family transcriptional regulator [Phaeocystidibacter marisrubri]GGH74581.1 transcriptional regulator [Phaeocystidibacter marisrubri]